MAGRLRPVGGEGVVKPGDVLHDDGGPAVDDALHLEAQRGRGAGFDSACRDVERRLRGPALMGLADLVELDAEALGDHRDHAAPGERERAREEQQWGAVEGLAEAHRLEEHLGLVVGVVVEDLHHTHRVDPLARAQQRQRQQVVGEARIDT